MSQFVYIPESDIWTDKVRMVQTKDPVLGGKDGPANWAAQDLTNRTLFLKKAVEAAQASANAANTAAKNADTKAVNAQTTANQAKTAAAKAQTTADDAKSAAATADGKAVAAQTSANTANTAAKNADTKAANAQTTANQAKTAAAKAQTTADDAKSAAATADGKAVAAQTTANTANTAAKNADTKAANAQAKANQVPNPVVNQFVVGNTTTAYKLMTVAQVKTLLGVPAAAKLYGTTGQATDGAMTQKAVTDTINALNIDYALVDFGTVTSAAGIHKKANPFGNIPVITIAEIKLGEVWTQYNWFEGTTSGQTYGITSGFNGSDLVIRVGSKAIVPKITSSSALNDAVNETHHEASASARMHVWRLKK